MVKIGVITMNERIPHSATVILLWMFAGLFYIIVITNFGKKSRLIPAALFYVISIIWRKKVEG